MVQQEEYVLYYYNPALPAAIIHILIFTLFTAAHLYYSFTQKARYLIPTAVGGIFEVMGYTFRAVSHDHEKDLAPFAVQGVLILVAPCLFAASIYMMLGRVIRHLDGKEFSPVRPDRITKYFVCGDVVTFHIQAAGAGIMAAHWENVDPQTLGRWVVTGGLIVQMLLFGFFCIVAITFKRRYQASGTPFPSHAWRTLINMLLGASGLILVRSLFRLVEYGQGHSGYLMAHEAFLYVFDSLPMLAVMVVLGLVVRYSELLSAAPKAGVTQLEKQDCGQSDGS